MSTLINNIYPLISFFGTGIPAQDHQKIHKSLTEKFTEKPYREFLKLGSEQISSQLTTHVLRASNKNFEPLEKKYRRFNYTAWAGTTLGILIAGGSFLLKSQVLAIGSIALIILGLYRFSEVNQVRKHLSKDRSVIEERYNTKLEVRDSTEDDSPPCEALQQEFMSVDKYQKELILLSELHRESEKIENIFKPANPIFLKLDDPQESSQVEELQVIKKYFYDSLAITWSKTLTDDLNKLLEHKKLNNFSSKNAFKKDLDILAQELSFSKQLSKLQEEDKAELLNAVKKYFSGLTKTSLRKEFDPCEKIAFALRHEFIKNVLALFIKHELDLTKHLHVGPNNPRNFWPVTLPLTLGAGGFSIDRFLNACQLKQPDFNITLGLN